MLRVLLKKRLIESTSWTKRGKRKPDILGLVFSIILAVVCIVGIVKIFGEFAQKYCALRIDENANSNAREYELMTLVYSVGIAVGVISSVFSIIRSIFENQDMTMFAVMPIPHIKVFLSKLIELYIKQVITLLLVILPINATFMGITEHGAGYLFGSIGVILLLPVATLAIASIFALPVHLVKKWLSDKYVLLLIVATAFIGVVFYAYIELLDGIIGMLTSGDIKFFFSQNTIIFISSLCQYLYPANLLANITLGNRILKNLAIFIFILAVLGVAGYFIVYALFGKAYQLSQQGIRQIRKRQRLSRHKKSIMPALIYKEFLQVLHTPSYAIQYFSVAMIMPIMTYSCAKMAHYALQALVFVNCDLELSLFLVLIFGCLTNTFCATNISRDGKMFLALKTMPLKPSYVLGSKIVFNLIVSVIAEVLSVAVLGITGFLSVGQCFYVFAIAIVHATAQICFATRKDLSKAKFADETNTVRESNSIVSTIIVFGMIIAFVMGGISLYMSVVNGIQNQKTTFFTYTFNTLFTVATFGLSLAYMLIGLRNVYNKSTEEA